jgi:hypothetical protein
MHFYFRATRINDGRQLYTADGASVVAGRRPPLLVVEVQILTRTCVSHAVYMSAGARARPARFGAGPKTYNTDPPLSDLTMLACVLQAAKTPSRNGGPFYGPNRGGPTFSNSLSKIKLRRNRVKNTPQGFTLLLSPLDYTCSVKGIFHTSTLGHM